ncbi:YdiU family protein [Arthrobacter sp. TPD3018]|uniref:protein adenylyltransferase SelO family protein n=1 Tax=Bacteria TaxID=2 RepID=UPI000D5060CF|nr:MULTISPECIES: YdiU family protein [Bacteria]PVE54553.1 YdiU family protein [Sphingomonas sp. TPD3009]PVE54788.1 YdiU family protein [Arthrobacter sp. TPD3018]PVE82628.1 YdiU family protein [Sphingomonas melonis]
MPTTPQAYRPATALLDLGDTIATPVEAADFPETRLRFRNDRAAAEVGLATLDDSEWIQAFGRFQPLPGTLPQPLALRYHGHQFRQYNPDIGDGRGFTFAQMYDDAGRLMDLGTKGSGQTPYSRFGDGRLTLKGGVREILATEMLEALNVPTSRTLSLIETDEELVRGDEPSPTRSAVLVRLSHSHIRIGTFQRLAYERDEAGMRALVRYVLHNLYGEESDDPIRLLTHVVERTARLAARYMAAGFVHGVLNSDNINVTGESFDYGPWRFASTWDPAFTAAYFDHAGLYAFGRQPEAIHWDVMQLAASLRLIAESDPLIAALETFPTHYQREIANALLWRIGVTPRGGDEDRALVRTLERTMRATEVAIDRLFFDMFGGALPDRYGSEWDDLRAALAPYAARKPRDHAYWQGSPCSMLIDEVEAIWSPIADADDWSRVHAKVAAIRAMGDALA